MAAKKHREDCLVIEMENYLKEWDRGNHWINPVKAETSLEMTNVWVAYLCTLGKLAWLWNNLINPVWA